ncbi:MAG: hypothetical protein ABFD91_04105 [Anaerohalosphaeraceae bacterium]
MENPNQNQSSDKNRPAFEIRAGKVRASVWTKQKQTDDGRDYTEYSISIEKSYKKDGEWEKQKMTLFPDELPDMVLAIQKAFEFSRLQ